MVVRSMGLQATAQRSAELVEVLPIVCDSMRMLGRGARPNRIKLFIFRSQAARPRNKSLSNSQTLKHYPPSGVYS
jgi:hypothetical protein